MVDGHLHDGHADALSCCIQIASIRVLERRHCGFVTFEARSSAEKAAEELQNRLIVRGSRCKLMWGRPQQERSTESVPTVPTNMLPPQVGLATFDRKLLKRSQL